MKFIVYASVFWSMLAQAAPMFDVVQHIGYKHDEVFHNLQPAGLCSGSIVRIEGQLFELTAAHCLRTSVEGGSFPFSVARVRFEVTQTDRDELPETDDSIPLGRRDYIRYDLADLALAKIEKLKSKQTNVLELRTTPLTTTENLTINGYGGGVGPQKVICHYRGTGTAEQGFVHQSGTASYMLVAGLDCSAPADANGDGKIDEADIRGFSGGPILDANNKVVGVTSSTSRMRSDGQMEILMIPMANTKVIQVGSGLMIVPKARVISGGLPDLTGLKMAAAIRIDALKESKICLDDRGLPQAYDGWFQGQRAITFVKSEIGERPDMTTVGQTRESSSIEVYANGGMINFAGQETEFAKALDHWKSLCEGR